MEVYNVGLLKLLQPCDIRTAIGYVYLKKVLEGEMQIEIHHEAFPKEMPFLKDCILKSYNIYVICLLVAHKHLHLNTMIVKCPHQTVCRYCRTACLLAGIYY